MKRSRVLYEKVLVSHQIVPYTQQGIKPQAIKHTLHQLWQHLVTHFTHPPEPKVHKKSNRRGDMWWEVYDPYTNMKASFTSELEVRMWLDQRHYR
jgi:hypothetical protein